jgi:cytochrome c551/c552
MKKLLIITGLALFTLACSSSGKSDQESQDQKKDTPPQNIQPTASGDDQGIGKFRDVKIDPTLNMPMVNKGKAVYEMKCSACHKLTDERLVGPGWTGVTSRHRPEWIMNFATNVDEMLNKDPKAQAQLEVCLVRMPNQNLTDEDARSVYEFMRQNDGVK